MRSSPELRAHPHSRLRRALRFCCAAIVAAASLMVTGDVADAQGGVRIRDIQGAAHRSPLTGTAVSGVPGIVTGLRSNGFYMQDPLPDTSDATSEGIFVFTSSAPTVAVGDSVTVSGNVTEFRPGGSGGLANLTLTEITSPAVVRLSSGNPLPAPVVVGAGGRVPPANVIDDDATGSVETSGSFNHVTDGIDFYESLEAMRVQIDGAVAVGPTNNFGELPVLANDGAGASVRTSRGGIVIQPGDFNPERVIADDEILRRIGGAMPLAKVNDRFTATLIGILDYSFGNFKLMLTAVPTLVDGGLTRETATPAGTGEVAIAGLNVENLAGTDAQSRFDQFAQVIVGALRSPDVLALQEIQDNNGATNDSIVDATVTLTRLVDAIAAAGGPAYQFRQINPVDDQDGGQPGGNIRNAFLYRADRGLSFVDRPGGGSTVATGVINSAGAPQLQHSPGRIEPANPAFNASRKPLVGEFTVGGRPLFVVNNHFNSKGGDNPLFGHFQPPVLVTEAQRLAQAELVHDFSNAILSIDPLANVVVLGDINDFQFSPVLATLKGTILHDLVTALPLEEQYTYVFDGNSQVLDHILVSTNLRAWGESTYDIVHVNSEFPDQLSDHEPEVFRFSIDNSPPPVIPEAPLVALLSASGLGVAVLVGALITGRRGRRTLTPRRVT